MVGCKNEKNTTSSGTPCSLSDAATNGWDTSLAQGAGGSRYFNDISHCKIETCNSSYGVNSSGKGCVPLTVSCAVSNGTGSQAWDDHAYSTCVATSCDAGYILTNGSCELPPDIYAITDSQSGQQDQDLLLSTSTLLSNDSSSHGETLTITAVSNPVGGTVTLSGTTITFSPSVKTGHAASFKYTVEDQSGHSTQGTVNVTVTPLPTLHALIFDASEIGDVSTLLSATPPTMTELFDDWGRFEEAKAGTYTPNNSTVNSPLTIPGAHSGTNYALPAVSNFFVDKQDTLDYQNTVYGAYGASVIQGLVGGVWTWFEGLSWSFDAGTNTIKSTVNSRNYIGFVSPNKFDNYQLSATLTSTNNDDDTIALVIAYVRDDLNNKAYTLSAVRTQGGNVPSNGFGIMYNINQSDAQLLTTDTSVGGVNTNALGGNGWSGRYSRVQVQRNGDIIKVMASPWNSLTLEPTSLLEIDLSSDPKLSVFQGEQYYGFAAYSQQDSSFTDIEFSAGTNLNQSIIYDLANNKIYEYVGGVWVESVVNLADELGYPREVYNPQTNKTYIIDEFGNISLKP